MNGNYSHGAYYGPVSSAHSSVSSPLSPQTSPPFQFSMSQSPPPPKEKEAKVLSWEDFSKFLSADLLANAERPASGALSDGRFYTSKNQRKEHYLLFNSKGDYIANFVHYYFSRHNLARDLTLQNLMVDGAVPVQDLLNFPKLSQVGTTNDELISGLCDSHKVNVVSLANGKIAVERKDKWSPINGPYDQSLGMLPAPVMPSSYYAMPPLAATYTTTGVQNPYLTYYQGHPGQHMTTVSTGAPGPTGYAAAHGGHPTHQPLLLQFTPSLMDPGYYQTHYPGDYATTGWRHGQ